MKADLNRFAPAYEDTFSYSLDNRLIMGWYPHRILRRTTGQSLLELGLGHGYTTQIFAPHFRRHVVIDASSEIIQRFTIANPGLHTELNEAYFEEFESSEVFDTIIMGFILEHVDDPDFILRRYRKNLADEGSLFVAVPNYEALNKRFGHAAGMIADMSALSDADLQAGHQRLFSMESLTKLATSAEYQIRSVEGIFLKPITTAQITQLQLSEAVLRGMLEIGVDYPELSVGILMELRK